MLGAYCWQRGESSNVTAGATWRRRLARLYCRVVPPSRLRATVLLLALAGVQLLTVSAAIAGDPSCLCDAEMCIHHPGHDHSAHTAASQSVEPPAAQHCAHGAGAAAQPRECSMRGCEQHDDELLPLSPLVSLADPTTVARTEAASALPAFTVSLPRDRPTAVEPPPPRFFQV